MTVDDWQLLFSFVGLGLIALMALSILLLRLTLDRRVRKEALPADKVYDAFTDWHFGFGRSIVFGWACALPYINNTPTLRALYNNVDIAGFANRIEKTIAYCMAVSVFTLVGVCVPLFFITKWLGIFVWPDA